MKQKLFKIAAFVVFVLLVPVLLVSALNRGIYIANLVKTVEYETSDNITCLSDIFSGNNLSDYVLKDLSYENEREEVFGSIFDGENINRDIEGDGIDTEDKTENLAILFSAAGSISLTMELTEKIMLENRKYDFSESKLSDIECVLQPAGYLQGMDIIKRNDDEILYGIISLRSDIQPDNNQLKEVLLLRVNGDDYVITTQYVSEEKIIYGVYIADEVKNLDEFSRISTKTSLYDSIDNNSYDAFMVEFEFSLSGLVIGNRVLPWLYVVEYSAFAAVALIVFAIVNVKRKRA